MKNRSPTFFSSGPPSSSSSVVAATTARSGHVEHNTVPPARDMGAAPSTQAATPRRRTNDPHRRRRRRRRGKARYERRSAKPPLFDRLPREVFSNVQSFLLGIDLFRLSHVNRRLFYHLANAQLWNARMPNYDFNPAVYQRYLQETAKMRYAQGRSIKFPGVSMDSRRTGVHDRGGSIALPRIVRMFELDPIAFDLWFCLLPPHPSNHVFTGGVLFGSQSEPAFSRHRPSQHEHMIHVDAERNLYCSLLWQKPIVATKLSYNRWYHVALSFNGEEQRVYVSGKLMHINTSRQMTGWSDLPYAQLGTGLLTSQSPGRPFTDFYGWYGLFGLIDDFRIWNQALTAEQIQKLAKGEFLKTSPSYRLKRVTGTGTCGRVHTVRCSRPVERVVEIAPVRSKKRKLHQWLSKVRRSGTESANCISIPA